MAAEDRQEFDWDLPINVPTIGVHRTLRVTSSESIGAVMIKLASKLGECLASLAWTGLARGYVALGLGYDGCIRIIRLWTTS